MISKENVSIDNAISAAADDIFNEYELLSLVDVEYNKPLKSKLLSGKIPLKCRFCDKHYPAVSFKKNAHAIPEFIGNKSLFSSFECDSCNQFFGKYENEFANFMLPYNALSGVINKSNKATKYKQDIVVYNGRDNQINIEEFPDEISLSDKMIEFSLNKPSYIPDYIYRCLTKIGLTIMPEDSLEEFQYLFTWLRDLSEDCTYPGRMIFSIFPFENPSSSIRCMLLKVKKPQVRKVPSVILHLAYQNFTFQTFLPVSTAESTGELHPFPYLIPSILDFDSTLRNRKSVEHIDLTGKEKVKGEKADFVLNNLDK